jgi:hypothetical protein
VKLAKERSRLESVTIRLPSSLKGVIYEAAKRHDRSFSEEIRDALQTHFRQASATATKKDIQEAILEHVTRMHSSPQRHYHKMSSEEAGLEIPSPKPRINKSREVRADAKSILEILVKNLRDGNPVTAKQLELETGIPSREISRLLKEKGILARNTRRRGMPGRYFLPDVLPIVEDAWRREA